MTSSKDLDRTEKQVVRDDPEGTRLTLVESGFEAIPRALRRATLPRNHQGWTIRCDDIRNHVSA